MSATNVIRPYLLAALGELYTTVEGADEIADTSGNPVIVVMFEGEKSDGRVQTVKARLRIVSQNTVRPSQADTLIGISSEIAACLYSTVRAPRGLVVSGATIFPSWFDVTIGEVKIVPDASLGKIEMTVEFKTTGGGLNV